MALQTTWFILITIVWSGFFVLEGFDFGVGMLVPFLGHDDTERRVLRATTGPFWDGNEVWLVVAGGATFAAFPPWYATLFSAYYLPLFLVLVGLILRGVAVEFRDKVATSRWRTSWDWLMAGSCLLVPLLIGVAIGGMLGGLPIDQQQDFTGGFGDLVQPYALLTGITFTTLCLFQGLMFLRLKTTGALAERASRLARPVSIVVVALLVVFMVWTQTTSGPGVIPGAGAWLALIFGAAAGWLTYHHVHRGWGFVCSSGAIGFTVLGFFAELYPRLMVSTTSSSFTLTTADSSARYSLTLMTIVALVMLPVVLLYTAWSYRIFRQRITVDDVSPAARATAAGDTASP